MDHREQMRLAGAAIKLARELGIAGHGRLVLNMNFDTENNMVTLEMDARSFDEFTTSLWCLTDDHISYMLEEGENKEARRWNRIRNKYFQPEGELVKWANLLYLYAREVETA